MNPGSHHDGPVASTVSCPEMISFLVIVDDLAVLDTDVAYLVELRLRIHDPAIENDQVVAVLGRAAEQATRNAPVPEGRSSGVNLALP